MRLLNFEPVVLIPIVLTTVWYLIGLRRLQRLPSFRGLFTARQAASFLCGQLTLVLALLSPLDGMADQLFSAHMVQHMVLLLIAPPLLVWGRPAVAFLWAFGPTGRRNLGRFWKLLGLGAGFQGLMHPLVVWTLFCGLFIFWHFPGPYQWALRNDNLHTLEHVSFLATALMFWTVVIEPSGRRRLTYAATLLFILTAAILSSLPGAIITLASTPLYPYYAHSTAAWGLTPLQDQQLAGLLMWIPGGTIYLIAAGSAFVHWLDRDDARRPGHRTEHRPRRVIAGHTRAALAVLLCIGAAMLLSGCGSSAAASSIGDSQRGAADIRAAGCGSCHIVPGINDATGLVGPPLIHMGKRIFIAGLLRNTPDNMITWLIEPQSIVPGNAMPNMGLTEQDARDITAYLFTLQ